MTDHASDYPHVPMAASDQRPASHAKAEIRALTGLRGVAAVIVMLYHFFERDAYFQPYVPSLIKRGYLGVDVFFVLSGFVMAISYARIFRHSIKFRDYAGFLVKRIARVYPLYIVMTLLYLVKYEYNFSGVWPNNFHLDDFLACALMVQGWGFGFSNVAGSTWSLSTEFFAYLLFPALVYLAVFARPSLAMGLVLVSGALLHLVASSSLGVSGPLDVVDSSSILPVLRCLAGFCLGLIGFRLAGLNRIQPIFASSWAVGGFLGVLLLAASLQATDLILYATFPPLVLSLYYDRGLALRLFGNRLVYHLGVVSYSIYLVHPMFAPVKTRLEPAVERLIGVSAHWAVLLLVVAASWAFACLLYRFIEMPGRRYLQRVLLRRGSQTAREADTA